VIPGLPAPGAIAVVGGALADVRAATPLPWVSGRSLPGKVRLVAGGAARNVAVNLALFGHRVTLLTAVGDDPLAEWLLAATALAGVDVGHAVRLRRSTGMYVTAGPEGEVPWCVSDAGSVEALGPHDLDAWAPLLVGSRLVVGDANLLPHTHQALVARSEGRPRVLLATSPDKAPRLKGVLEGAAVLVCNRAEAAALTAGDHADAWEPLASSLLTLGVRCAVVTCGRDGVGVMRAQDAAWAPADAAPVVDPTGAGDAVAAVAVHACLTGMSARDTAVLASRAAAVAVGSLENTPTALAEVIRR
jgi:sugar/nucleoside kinase (ribokinase family)